MLSDEQRMLRSLARDFLSSGDRQSLARRYDDAPGDVTVTMTAAMDELGWTALGIPEDDGGSGTFSDLVVLLEECGRVLLPGPFTTTMGLGVSAAVEAASPEQRHALLTEVAFGRARVTVALPELGIPEGDAIAAIRAPGGWRLDGRLRFVPDAHEATDILVTAQISEGGNAKTSLFRVGRGAAGLAVEPMRSLDTTHHWCEIALAGVELPDDALLGDHDAAAPLRRAAERAGVALAAEMCGGMGWILDSVVEHARTRVQFGRPIGSFQAVSHRLADLLVDLEAARTMTRHAAWTIDTDAEERSAAAAAAKLYAAEAYRRAAATGIHVLGGIGFTWEHDMHLHYRRAKAYQLLVGGQLEQLAPCFGW